MVFAFDSASIVRTAFPPCPLGLSQSLSHLQQNGDILEATVEYPRGSVEKLSLKESVKGAHTVLRGSVRAPEGFLDGKPEAAKPRGRSP